MKVRIPVGSGHQYMQTERMHNPAIMGEVCATDYAREESMDLYAIRHELLATEIKLAAPRMAPHERHFHEGYRDRLQHIADEIERETAPLCAECEQPLLSNQPRYSCAPSGDIWHEVCYSYEPGDEEEPVKFFECDAREDA